MTTNRLDRYPGVRPFTDTPEDQAVFFGRGAEIDSLFNRTLATRLLVLFGQSGLGKTSLLRAGVFPRLRDRAMLPLEVRVGQTRNGGSLVEIASEAASVACVGMNIDYTPGEGETLWEFFKTAMFWRNEELLIPVLVLDQFEEIFTLVGPERRKALAAEIGAAASGAAPAAIRERHRSGAEPTGLSEDAPNVKIVLSLREEYVGALEELSDDIPGIFQDRVRLAPMGEAQARDAIQKPAVLRHIALADEATRDFAVAPFVYDDEALGDMLAVLKGKSGTIEPIQLQMLCQHVEQRVAAKTRQPGAVTVGRKEVGGQAGLRKVFQSYYRKKLGELPWRERQRVGELCEIGLLTPDGHRLMLEQSQIEQDYHVGEPTLTALVNSGLLRQEPRLESLFFEISHDNLAQPILTSRPFWRLVPKKTRYAIGAVCAALIAIIVLQQHYRTQTESARDKAERLVSFLIGEDLSRNLRRIGDIGLIEQVQNKVNEYYRQSAGEVDTPIFRINRAAAYRNDGDLSRQLGKLTAAKNDYEKAEKSLRAILRRDLPPKDTREGQRELATILSRLGRVEVAQGNLPGALGRFEKSLDIRETLHAENKTDIRLAADLAEGLRERGEILITQHAVERARDEIENSLALQRRIKRLSLEKRRAESRRLVRLQGATWLAEARVFELLSAKAGRKARDYRANVKEAFRYYREALKVAGALARTNPNDSEALHEYAIVLIRAMGFVMNPDIGFLADSRARSRTRVKAVEFLLAASTELKKRLDHLRKVEPRNKQTEHDSAMSDMIFAKIAIAAASLVGRNASEKDAALVRRLSAAAPKLFQRAVKRLETLVNLDDSNLGWRMDLARARVGLGYMLARKGGGARARALFQKGFAAMDKLVTRDPSNIDWQYDLLDGIGKSQEAMAPGQQTKYLEMALRILKGLREKNLLYADRAGSIERMEEKLKRYKIKSSRQETSTGAWAAG